MSSRNLLASVLMACLLAVGFLGTAPMANAKSGGKAFLKPGKSIRGDVMRIKRRSRGLRIHLPVGPASVYCEYPYYYSRGHYPTHIGGYVYYPSYYLSTCLGGVDILDYRAARRARRY
jgi:hypothetical protein